MPSRFRPWIPSCTRSHLFDPSLRLTIGASVMRGYDLVTVLTIIFSAMGACTGSCGGISPRACSPAFCAHSVTGSRAYRNNPAPVWPSLMGSSHTALAARASTQPAHLTPKRMVAQRFVYRGEGRTKRFWTRGPGLRTVYYVSHEQSGNQCGTG